MAFEVLCFGEAATTYGALAQDHACNAVSGGEVKCPAEPSREECGRGGGEKSEIWFFAEG